MGAKAYLGLSYKLLYMRHWVLPKLKPIKTEFLAFVPVQGNSSWAVEATRGGSNGPAGRWFRQHERAAL